MRGCAYAYAYAYAYAWDNDSGSTTRILRLKPGANPRTDAWKVDSLPVSGSNSLMPTSAQGRGTYCRAFYWHTQDVFVILNAVDERGLFFRLS